MEKVCALLLLCSCNKRFSVVKTGLKISFAALVDLIKTRFVKDELALLLITDFKEFFAKDLAKKCPVWGVE